MSNIVLQCRMTAGYGTGGNIEKRFNKNSLYSYGRRTGISQKRRRYSNPDNENENRCLGLVSR